MSTIHTSNPISVQTTDLDQVVNKSSVSPQQTSENQSQSSKIVSPSTIHIFDYMCWSMINLAVGGIILGIPAIILSILIRKYKHQGHIKISKILSMITLIYNIFISFVALLGMVFVITHYTGVY